ncbi:MAG: GAF domain-containing sensor histidine kinase [Planctomycetes bacterium]|nr:GAF domain-containing sensor histidine kinase [Planctomycetota bacterium]
MDEQLAETRELRGRVTQLTKLLEVAKVMSFERDLDHLLTFIAEQLTSGLDCDRCAIFLVDDKTREIVSRVALGAVREIRFPMGQGIAGAVIATGEVINIADAYADSRFNRRVDDETGYRTHNLICVPMKNLNGAVIGAFEALNKKHGPFTHADQNYLLAFGSQAAVAVESAKAHQERERYIKALLEAQTELRAKMNQIDTLYHLERELSSTQDFESFMTGVIRRSAAAMGASAGSVMLVDDGAPGKTSQYIFPSGDEAGALGKLFLEGDDGIGARVVKSGQAFLENRLLDRPEFTRKVSDTQRLERRNIMAAPLLLQEMGVDRILGALAVFYRRDGDFGIADLHVLEVIAAQVTSAILRKRMLAEREKSNRLATIGTLASSIIHDIKNPMSIIRGYGQIMSMGEQPKEKRDRYCKIMVAEIDRCVNMTKEILAFARGEKSYNFVEIPARKVIDDVAMVLENEMETAKIEFERVVEFEGTIRVDQDKLKRVIFNLSNNALAVMPNGGKFSLTCKPVEGWVEFRVRDTGPGVPEELKPKLFGAFQTMGKKDGTGLGLCIAKEICEGHGGTIRLDDTVSPGACFVIRIKPAS